MVTTQFVSRSAARIAMSMALVAVCLAPQIAGAVVVRMETTLGVIDIDLYEDGAPRTVRNFLNYAGRNYYNGIVIHRSAPGFVIQGGGYGFSTVFGSPVCFRIPPDAPIQNEFSPTRSNVLGTIAMAKLPGDPDSATSEWFFNLADNSANLDNQNGGFTVFGSVSSGMSVVNAIAALPIANASSCNSAFSTLPVINLASGLQESNLIYVTGIPNVKSSVTLLGTYAIFVTDVDMTFNSVVTVDSATSQSLLATFPLPPNSIVQFYNGILSFTTSSVLAQATRTITLFDSAGTRPTRYYAYGPTAGNPSDHWYDFTFDGETGAEITENYIKLHFVDGKRGDNTLVADGSITHTGAPAVETSADSKSKIGGCTISETSSRSGRGGDWGLIAAFLVLVALTRKRLRA